MPIDFGVRITTHLHFTAIPRLCQLTRAVLLGSTHCNFLAKPNSVEIHKITLQKINRKNHKVSWQCHLPLQGY